MFHKQIALIFIILFVFCSCINDQKQETGSIRIEIQNKIKLDDQAAQNVYSLYPIASASSNNEIIALANYRNPIGITLIDYRGNFIQQIGTEGRGPDEIQSARFIGLDNHDNVVINDKVSALIKKYDRSDNSVHTYSNYTEEGIDITSRDMKQCGNHWVLSINHHEYAPSDTSSMISIFDEDFEIVEMFGTFDPFMMGQKTTLQDPLFSVDCENKQLYSTHVKVPFIQVYDLESPSKVGRTEHIPPSFKLSDTFIDRIEAGQQRDYLNFLIEEQSVSLLLSHTESYVLHSYRNDTNKFYETRNFLDREHFVAVYSRNDMSYLGEVAIEGAILGSTKEGYLITLTNDDPVQLDLIEVSVESENNF